MKRDARYSRIRDALANLDDEALARVTPAQARAAAAIDATDDFCKNALASLQNEREFSRRTEMAERVVIEARRTWPRAVVEVGRDRLIVWPKPEVIGAELDDLYTDMELIVPRAEPIPT